MLGETEFTCSFIFFSTTQVKVGRYYLEQLIADLDSSKESSKGIRKRLSDPTALGEFLQLCHLRLLHERDVRLAPFAALFVCSSADPFFRSVLF